VQVSGNPEQPTVEAGPGLEAVFGSQRPRDRRLGQVVAAINGPGQ